MHFPPSYQVPPPIYDYRASPSSSSEGLYNYIKYPLYTPSPPQQDGRQHSRRASHSPVTYTYATPQPMPTYFSPPQYSYSPNPVVAYTTKPAVPKQRRDDMASMKDRARTKAGRSSDQVSPKQSKSSSSKKQQLSSRSPKSSKSPPRESNDYIDQHGQPLSYNEEQYYYAYPDDIDATYKQTRGRTRAASYPEPQPERRPERPSRSKKPKAPRVATAEDALNAGLPAGFSYKNWDPDEPPILLLGSVFDANSLGKWIYDWTVSHYGPHAPMSDVAGELWLQLIELNGKGQRLDECLPRIRHHQDKKTAKDFLQSRDKLWEALHRILKACEGYMYSVAEKESKSKGKKVLRMTSNSGVEFVRSMFGIERELEETERLMTRIRRWTINWDATCEELCVSYS